MKNILLFGAGKSATVLIEYLLANALKENWFLTLVDADLDLAKSKLNGASSATALSFDIKDDLKRKELIQTADLVLSLMPPALHLLIANDCILYKKNLLTASYIDENMALLKEKIEANDLIFLCEMGLDPGIDHMSAKKMIDSIIEEKGKIISFYSHCGGLVAPESDDNPWHYKISWNPMNIINAGKAGAIFKKENEVVKMSYQQLFEEKRFVDAKDHELICWYPNRDSLKYIETYGLQDCSSFIRTTLRHPDFIYGWKNIIDLNLTAEDQFYDTDGLSLQEFFKQHLEKNNFKNWLQQKLNDKLTNSKKYMEELVKIQEMENDLKQEDKEAAEEFMVVAEDGQLHDVNIDELKTNIAASLAFKMHEANLTLKQLFYLGMDDNTTMINQGKCSAAAVLCFILDKKLALKDSDKDMVVMIHEIIYEKNGKRFKATASFTVKGKNKDHTAMAQTVGLPLAIAAKLILTGNLNLRGLHIPILPSIYEPVLSELESLGINFNEEIIEIDQPTLEE